MTDDILVFGKTPEEHENNLMLILKTLEENGITLYREKCNFYKDEVTFFGLKFSKDGVSPTEDRFKIIKEASIPNNAKELHSFLCSMVWSSRFVKNAYMVADPLWRLTRTGTPWYWGDVEQKAFEDYKRAVEAKPMSYFNPAWNTEVETDATPYGLAAVLIQRNLTDRIDVNVITNVSRMLTDVK